MTSTHLKTSTISIIIPVLNEQENIAALADNLRSGNCEIIVVDGGSTDRTAELIQQYPHLTLVSSKPGRAIQLNRGAQQATGEILLFLHADTRLPRNFAEAIVALIHLPNTSAGAFKLSIENPTPAMRFICWCSNLRSRLWQLPYGDQAIFALKHNFFTLGMYPETPIMEDYLFIQKAKKSGKVRILPQSVRTSGRRWRRLGVLRTTLINQLVILGHYFNVPTEKLVSLYRR